MAERARRPRRQISDVTEDSESAGGSESGEEWLAPASASTSKRSSGRIEPSPKIHKSPGNTRSKRTAPSVPSNGTTSSASIQKPTSPEDRRQSIRLTVKVPPSKLREVMRANEIEALRDTLGGGRVLDGPRQRRAAAAANPRTSGRRAEKPKYLEYGESDLEDDAEGDDDDEGEGDEDLDDFDEIGAEAEGGTDEEEQEDDVEMEDAPIPPQSSKRHAPAEPKAPKIMLKAPAQSKKSSGQPIPQPTPKLVVTAPSVGPVKSVEDQEMEDDPGDSEANISNLSEDDVPKPVAGLNLGEEDDDGDLDEEEDEEDEEGIGIEGEIEDEDLDGEGGEDDDDDDDDDTDETPHSGMATPDITRLTKRQRGRPEDQTQLMALDMAPQQRKFFTDAEKAMKKDEHARKRKELTKRKTQEEKAAALNRLLKPQASKARGAAPKPETIAAATAAVEVEVEEEYFDKPNPLYTRWISDKDGIRLGVPEEWLGKHVGALFGPPVQLNNRALFQELD